MEILSLERLKNIKLGDIINPKIVRFIWETHEPNICELCASLNGKVMDASSPEYSVYQQPLHPRCKCSWKFVTSDAEKIPNVDWEKPKDSWIEKYAPFLFVIPFVGKKKEIVEIISEVPEIVFDVEDIFSIEDYIAGLLLININDAKQKMVDMEKDMPSILYIVFFLDSKGNVIVEKEAEEDTELNLTASEEQLINDRASYYLISEGNPVVENQLESLFSIRKR